MWTWNLNFWKSKVEARQDTTWDFDLGLVFAESKMSTRKKFQRFLEGKKKKSIYTIISSLL